MRVADYIVDFIARSLGCDRIFMVTGGGMMFLSDAVVCSDKTSAVCTHHEQAAAMAATAYAKAGCGFGCAFVTTGCGGTNAVTGLLNAWQDGAKAFFISGQVKRSQTIRNSGLPLRQFGVQEADIVSIVSPLTKYAVMVNEPEMIAFHLEKAKYLAESGHPGPVWLDIPMDVQGAIIDEDKLIHFEAEKNVQSDLSGEIDFLKSALASSKRPVILAGQGIDLAGVKDDFYRLIDQWQIPVVTSFLGGNSIASKHPLYTGRIGTKGNRAGNLAVQNADMVLVLGCRLSVSTTGHEFRTFARAARILVVDIDPTVEQKNTVKIDHFCQADLRDFLRAITFEYRCPEAWRQTALHWKKQYPFFNTGYQNNTHGIDLYCFLEKLSFTLEKYPETAVISDAGSSFYAVTQALQLDDSQRYITSGGQAEMGFSLPAAIGAAFRGFPLVAAITGDGSLQMNIQELQTVKHYNLPVKLFVWNNNGYLSIRATQQKFFDSRFIGTDARHGVSFPDLKKIADAYGLPFIRISGSCELTEKLEAVMRDDSPVICEIMCNPSQEIIPSVSSKRLPDGRMKSLPLEDMYPFLDREEFLKNMFIEPLPEDF